MIIPQTLPLPPALDTIPMKTEARVMIEEKVVKKSPRLAGFGDELGAPLDGLLECGNLKQRPRRQKSSPCRYNSSILVPPGIE